MINQTFSVISEDNRFRIVEILRLKPHSVNELVNKLGIRQPQVSKHLRVLNEAGIVKVNPIAQRRVYSLNIAPFRKIDSWLVSYRKIWMDRLNRLEKHITSE